MNILFISHSLSMGGGANRSMVQLMLELRNNHGVNPIVLAPKGKLRHKDYSLVEECQKHDIQVEQTIIPWFLHTKVWLHRAKYLAMFFNYCFLIQRLRKYNIKIVHSNGSVFDLGGHISRSLNVPHIWHLREFGTEDETVLPVWGNKYIKRAYQKGDVFIAISDAIKHSYEDRIPQNKIVRIYNGIDTYKYNKQSVHQNEIIQFTIVGVVTPHKNQLEAVKAVALLVAKGVTKFHLSIIGQVENGYIDEIKAFIIENNLSEYVSILGLRNDIPDILSKMDVGLMLSKSEAFGRVTVEYMFQNLLVIASNTGANPEIIKDGETGFIYQYGKSEELAEKMEYCINNPNCIKEVSRKGREYALCTFPSETNSKKVFELYQSLL